MNASVYCNICTTNFQGFEEDVFYPLVKHPLHVIIILSLAYGIAFLFAVVGNCFVIAVVLKYPWMRTVTNYFVVNLAVADLLIAIFNVPFTLVDNIYSGWRLGSFLCKATPFLQQVSVCVSVNTLALIAVDRYMAICNTWLSKISKTAARIAILCIWVTSIALSIPIVVFYEEYETHTGTQVIPMCFQLWPNFDYQRAYFVVGLFVLCYALPLLLIMVCYTSITVRVWRRHAPGVSNTCYSGVIHKSKIKVIKMFGIVISLYALSWLPLYVIFFKLYFSPPATNSKDFDLLFSIIIPISQWLGLCNSGINPMIYCFYSKKYRHGFKCLMMCKPYFYPSRYLTYQSGKNPHPESSSSRSEERISKDERVYNQARFMLVQYSDGNMTVSFRKEDTSQTRI